MSAAGQARAGLCRFRLLRYAPSVVSGEFYNVGLLLYDAEGRLIDARFTPDFDRLRCHPLVEMPYLRALRDEFEERRLLGEGMTEYATELEKNLSASVTLSEPVAVVDVADIAAEAERLVGTYLATPPRRVEADAEPTQGGRRWIRARMRDAFDKQGLLNGGGLRGDVEVQYGGPRLTFTFDFGYASRDGADRFLHALGSRAELERASQLGLVFERYRAGGRENASLTVVGNDAGDEAARDLLLSCGVAVEPVGAVDRLAERVRAELFG